MCSALELSVTHRCSKPKGKYYKKLSIPRAVRDCAVREDFERKIRRRHRLEIRLNRIQKVQIGHPLHIAAVR